MLTLHITLVSCFYKWYKNDLKCAERCALVIGKLCARDLSICSVNELKVCEFNKSYLVKITTFHYYNSQKNKYMGIGLNLATTIFLFVCYFPNISKTEI